MRSTNVKKYFTTITSITLALAISLTLGLTGRPTADAKADRNLSSNPISWAANPVTTTQTGVTLPSVPIYALTSDNMIYVLNPGATSFSVLGRVPKVNGNLIGIDFRVGDQNNGRIYGLTDTGNLLLISLTPTIPLNATVISTLSPRFAGGFQSLFDFNPVVNAIRIQGSNDQNFAVTSANGGNLNNTVVQTKLAYAAGDVNANVDPNVSAGAYTNNYIGATTTIFYAIDYDLDTFLTIAPPLTGTGSSNTGGGQLQTIGNIVDASGAPLNLNPTADIDIYTNANGVNSLVGINNETIFTINLSQINPSLPLGQTQKVVANTTKLTAAPTADAFIDIAIPPVIGAGPAPSPTATPTPTPTPTAITIQAENAILGGGSTVATNQTGFTGTAFVDYADNVANSYVEFVVPATGTRTFTFRYSNGSTANRACVVTVNGVPASTLAFAPTGSFSTWSTTSVTLNLGSASGARVRVTSSTVAGGPNLDKVDIK